MNDFDFFKFIPKYLSLRAYKYQDLPAFLYDKKS